jgi:8-oxo-dGTP diphosphatase
MSARSPAKPDSLSAYVVLVLEYQGKYLLLPRARTKRFAPGLWTGVGGLAESHELGTLQAAGLRELYAETGIRADDVSGLTLRRVLLHARDQLTLLLYFTGKLSRYILPDCTEGTLAWIAPERLSTLRWVDNARIVIPLLVEDHQRDPKGLEPARLGVAHDVDGRLERIVWV